MRSVAAPDRAPGGLDGPRDGYRLRRSLLLLALAGLVVLLLQQCDDREPDYLAQTRLVGGRAPAALDFVVLLDESGSFADHAATREQVLAQVASWTPRNLRPDDTVTVLGFSGDAYTKLETTAVGAVPPSGLQYRSALGTGGTAIVPALELAADSVRGARSRALIVVTDTLVSDADSADLAKEARRLRITSMSLVVPSGTDVNPAWHDAFEYEATFDAPTVSVGETSVAIGRAIAHATGQRLEVER